MNKDYKNYYQICRIQSGLKQFEAAELLNISRRTLLDYETWIREPPQIVVKRMVELYNSEWLGWWYLKNVSIVGKKLIPDIPQEMDNKEDIFTVFYIIDGAVDEIIQAKQLLKKLLKSNAINKEDVLEYAKLRDLIHGTAGRLMGIYTFEPKITEKNKTRTH